jgi:hypothetical protein
MDRHPQKALRHSRTVALTALVTQAVAACRVPFNGVVTSVTYVPDALITGANTNTRTVALKNRGQDGNGANVVATLALTAGVNAPAFDEKALPLNTTLTNNVATNLVVAKGDILSFESNSIGMGLADPGGLILIEFTRTS